MPQDTAEDIASNLLLHYEGAGIARARLWVQNAFRDLVKRRLWSWKIRRGQFIFPSAYGVGTISATQGLDTIIGVGTIWTPDMIGRQFRVASTPLYTIKNVFGPTSLQLDRPWGSVTMSGISYEIFLAYVTAPESFEQFISVVNPAQAYQLDLGLEQRQLDQNDPQRTNSGSPYAIASADYSGTMNGQVGAAIQSRGSGSVPASGGAYTGVDVGLFTAEITTGGDSGTAIFQWKKDGGAYTSGVATSATGNELQDGVSLSFPTGANYVVGDVFSVVCQPGAGGGLPRFEIWPHVKVDLVLSYIYEAAPPDIFDPAVTIPRSITADALLEGGLAKLARWPGPSVDEKNPYFQIALAEAHENRFNYFCERLEQKDDNIYPTDVSYYRQFPYYETTWRAADWIQRHG